jgi:uncharacterized protein YjbI with pentapeptide repeats
MQAKGTKMSRQFWNALLLGLVSAVASTTGASTQAQQSGLSQVERDKVLERVVTIEVTAVKNQDNSEVKAFGNGTIIASDGLVLTAKHLLEAFPSDQYSSIAIHVTRRLPSGPVTMRGDIASVKESPNYDAATFRIFNDGTLRLPFMCLDGDPNAALGEQLELVNFIYYEFINGNPTYQWRTRTPSTVELVSKSGLANFIEYFAVDPSFSQSESGSGVIRGHRVYGIVAMSLTFNDSNNQSQPLPGHNYFVPVGLVSSDLHLDFIAGNCPNDQTFGNPSETALASKRTGAELLDEGRKALPGDWKRETDARTEFIAEWCELEQLAPCPKVWPQSAEDAWRRKRDLEYLRMPKGVASANEEFRGEDLTEALLVNADFRSIDLSRANISYALFENATFLEPVLQNSWLIETDFSRARINNGDFGGAVIVRPELLGANLIDVDLSDTLLVGNYLAAYPSPRSETYSDNDVLLYLSSMKNGVNFSSGAIEDLYLPYERLYDSLHGEHGGIVLPTSVNGAALRFADSSSIVSQSLPWEQVRLEDMFGDGSVAVGTEILRPCHWLSSTLGDAEYFARWRGFREAIGMSWPPSESIGRLNVNVAKNLVGVDFVSIAAPRYVKVAELEAIPLPDCSSSTGIPCLEKTETEFSAPNPKEPWNQSRVCGSDLRSDS